MINKATFQEILVNDVRTSCIINTKETKRKSFTYTFKEIWKKLIENSQFFCDFQDDKLVNKHHLLKHFNISLNFQKTMIVIKILDTKISQKHNKTYIYTLNAL